TRINIYNALHRAGYSDAQIDLTSLDQIQIVQSAVFSTALTGCINYLDQLYASAFDRTYFSTDPLSIRLSPAPPGQTFVPPPSKDAKKRYDDQSVVERFILDQFDLTRDFVEHHLSSLQINYPEAMAIGALPARNIPSFYIKQKLFSQDKPACVQGTVLSEP